MTHLLADVESKMQSSQSVFGP